MASHYGFILMLFFLGASFALIHVIPILYSLLYVHLLFDRRHQRDSTRSPPVGVFVPCKGVYPGLKENLEAVACQEHKNFTVTFISESHEDPANQAIQHVVQQYPHCRHLVSGLATCCGQKNHNLLRGLARDSGSEVFVFCDADIQPSPKWLSTLVSSLDSDDVSVATGFVWITPSQQTLAGTLHSMMVAYEAAFMSNNSMRLAWGGTMAIRSDTLRQLRVAEEWSRKASDDVTLSHLLRDTKVKKVHNPRCLVKSGESMSSVHQVIEWFTRQILFLKFYLRSLWLIALAVHIPSSLIMMLTVPLIIGGFYHNTLRAVAFVCLGFSLTVMLAHTLTKLTHQDGQSAFLWFAASPLGQWIATYCLVKTIFISRIKWADVIYTLDRQGRVAGVHRTKRVTGNGDFVENGASCGSGR